MKRMNENNVNDDLMKRLEFVNPKIRMIIGRTSNDMNLLNTSLGCIVS